MSEEPTTRTYIYHEGGYIPNVACGGIPSGSIVTVDIKTNRVVSIQTERNYLQELLNEPLPEKEEKTQPQQEQKDEIKLPALEHPIEQNETAEIYPIKKD